MKNWKRIAAFALSATLLFGAAGTPLLENVSNSQQCTVFAETVTEEGLCFRLANGEVTITGCDTREPELVIPKTINGYPVTRIDDNAFTGCYYFTSISIPDSVTSIGEFSFNGCERVTTLTIPDSVTSIGRSAFSCCTQLTSVTIPDSVTSIGWYAFTGCSKLPTVSIPSSVTVIPQGMFSGCRKLASVSIPDSVTQIEKEAFDDCQALTTVRIPASVTCIGAASFRGCSALTSVSLANGLQTIDASAFAGCSLLTHIDIPDSVTDISWFAFDGCTALTSVFIGSGITKISFCAFYDCPALTDIYYAGSEEQWNAISLGIECLPLETAVLHFNAKPAVTAPVTNLKNVSGNAITWRKSADAVKYYIYKDGKKVATTLNTSFAFQTMTAGETYEIGVAAVSAKGVQSDISKVSVKAVSMLAKPTGLARNSASLCWNAVSGAKSYKVHVINPKNGKYVKTVSGITGTSFTFQGMTDGKTYQLRVCAVDEKGNLGKYAYTKTFTYKKPTVAPVLNLKNASGNAVSWTKSVDAVSYVIYLDGKKISSTRNNFFAFQTITAGTTYKVGVAAVNAKGVQSPAVSVKFKAPSILSAPTGLKRNNLTLSWSAVTGAKNYKVYLVEVDAKGAPLYVDSKVVTGKTYTFDKSKTTAGKTYQLRVCAMDKNGNLGKYASTKVFTAQ